jgi:glutamate synthase domain-containing protein 1
LEEQAARHTEEYYSWRNVATQYTTAQQKQREEQLDAQQTQQAQREEQLDAQQKLEQRELDHLIHLHFDVV